MIVFREGKRRLVHLFTDCRVISQPSRLGVEAAGVDSQKCAVCTQRRAQLPPRQEGEPSDYHWACWTLREVSGKQRIGFTFHLHRDCLLLRPNLHLAVDMAWGDVPDERWRCHRCDGRLAFYGERSVPAAGAGLPTLGKR